MIRTSIACAQTVMCCALVLASAAVPSDLDASTDCQVPLVVHRDHWEAPAVSEAELLAARILQREGRLFPADDAELGGLARDIDQVLSRIREEYPEMADIVAREDAYITTRIMYLEELGPNLLDVVDRALDNARDPVPLRTGNVEFDCLNALLGLRAIDVFHFEWLGSSSLELSFEHPIDSMEAMVRYSRERSRACIRTFATA